MSATVKIINTLTRFHKIAERVLEAVNERNHEILALSGARVCSVDDFATVKAKAAKEVEKLERLISERLILSKTYTTIRAALAKANTEHGVSDLLCQVEFERRECAALAQAGSVRCDDVDAAEVSVSKRLQAAAEILGSSAPNSVEAARRERQERVTFSIVSEASREACAENIRATKLRINALADKLAEANATRIGINIDTEAAKLLGLS